ncbi:MAG TPA: PBP1A family penicillin-binding protein [Burkholderiaceae bacterium]|nr:PBP1A family penicillin-binding protein [Burkholderiaceae bacterium]
MSIQPESKPDRLRALRAWLRQHWRRLTVWTTALAVAGTACALMFVMFMFSIAYVNLPPIDSLANYRPKIPLRIWSSDGVLLGEFGEERRSYVPIREVPQALKDAILSAEDESFYRHSGVDFYGLIRAAAANAISGRRGQGGSTITMQVARNFYLSSERKYIRKLYEIALAYKIESSLPKDRILEVYINQIYLGQRAYGFAAAAQTYFGKALGDLSLGECAMLAGLPAAPSAYNPTANLHKARVRQRYVLSRMLALGYIKQADFDKSVTAELKVRGAEEAAAVTNLTHSRVRAEYAAEIARQLVFDVFKGETYSRGLNVYTTISSGEQQVAYDALRAQVVAYDRRYGYRGPERSIELPPEGPVRQQHIDEALADAPEVDGMIAAVVLEATPKLVRAVLSDGQTVKVEGEGLRFGAASLLPKAQAPKRIAPGALIRLARGPKDSWVITQIPQAESAFVACDARDGAVRAFVGGFDFTLNKFDHVTQAWRQPGSSIKPFIYAAALEKGVMTSTLVNDEPLMIDPEQTGGQVWDPKDYDGKYEGPMRLRQGLAKSKNMVSIRVLQQIGPQYAQQYLGRFGFDPERHPPYLTMALGAGSVTPWQELGAYAVFANGGFEIAPYLIARVADSNGKVLMEASPRVAGDSALRVIDASTAFIMDSLLRDVAHYGTGARAASLVRADVAGKTGTTNDSHDAWFSGYGGGIVGVAWFGFDQPHNLGERETGGGLALPIWLDYMASALKGLPVMDREPPPGVVTIDGEYYLEQFPPGQGIASLGLDEGQPQPPPPEQAKHDENVF